MRAPVKADEGQHLVLPARHRRRQAGDVDLDAHLGLDLNEPHQHDRALPVRENIGGKSLKIQQAAATSAAGPFGLIRHLPRTAILDPTRR